MFQLSAKVATLSLSCAALLAACGGGGGGETGPAITAPADLRYSAPTSFYHVGVSIPENRPTYTGTVDRFEVEPALPAGLGLDAATGVLAGIPFQESPLASFTVTASGPLGSTDFELTLGAVAPPRFAFVATADSTLSTLLVDAERGTPTPFGFDHAPDGTGDADALIAAPHGNAIYVAHRGVGVNLTTLSVWSIDALTGDVTHVDSLPLGAGPHSLALAPDGLHLYATAAGSDQVWTYTIHPLDDTLLSGATALFTGDEPTAVRIDASGRFAYVAHRGDETVSLHRIDPDTGNLNLATSVQPTQGSPVDLVIDPAGGTAYALLNDTKQIQSFSIDPNSGVLEDTDELATGPLPSSIALHPTGRFAFVTESGSDRVVSYQIDAETGALTQSGFELAGDNPTRVTMDPAGLHVWVVASGSNELVIYDVDLVDGTLDESARFRTREGPQALGLVQGGTPIEPRARHMFVLGRGSNDIATYSVNPLSGGLTEASTTVPTREAPCDLAIDVQGRRMYVAAETGRSIEGFSIDTTSGQLTSVGTPTDLPGPPCGVVLDPSGHELYVVVREVNQILSFAVDPDTGALAAIAAADAGIDPTHLAMDPTGRFVHASNQSSRSISTYVVERGVFMGDVSIAPAPGEPREVRYSPHGDVAFVALHGSNILVPYVVDPEDGTLTPVPPGRGTESRPEAVVVAPSGAYAFATVSGPDGGTGYTASYRIREADSRLVDEFRLEGGLNPGELAVDPRGRYLYVLNTAGDDVSILSIDPIKAELEFVAAAPTGLAPSALVLTTALD